MSSSDLAGFGELAAELRLARPRAPEPLRAQLVALEAPAQGTRRSLRRPALLLAPAALAAAAVSAAVIGVLQSGGGSEPVVQRGAARTSDTLKAAPAPAAASGAEGALPAAGTRAQRTEAELTLRVHDLSRATKRALRLTGRLGGYVRTVDYGQGAETGTALLVLRVPVAHVQQAVVRFSGLGEILAQHVSIQDLQAGIDRRTREMARLRDRIAALTREGTPEALAQAALLRRRLVALQREQAQALRQARFATVSLRLQTGEAQVTPAPPGRIERALDRAGAILVDELVVLLYVLVVGVPLALVVAAAFLAGRLLRRRSLDRLLEQS